VDIKSFTILKQNFFIDNKFHSPLIRELVHIIEEKKMTKEPYSYHINILFNFFGWFVRRDRDNNIMLLDAYKKNQILQYEYLLFNCIAPFVENDSYIEFIDHNNQLGRWTFNHGQFKEITPNIIWGKPIIYGLMGGLLKNKPIDYTLNKQEALSRSFNEKLKIIEFKKSE